ncbi:MAG: ABC transporter ATP-binding protein [Epulopiscium sp.]|nr:ABC transporter ATP-binding protein [Candidatus Epulonipiscium sp.]
MLILNHVTKEYDDVMVLKDFSFSIEKGKIYSILGPSGCGKTTILRLIAELEKPDKGQIELRGQKVSYVFQEPRLLPWETVRKNLELVCPKKESKKIEQLLELMELKEYSDAYPKELSGGMKQRVSIMRGFLYPHDILLMDEPFQALDLKLKAKLIREIYSLHQSMGNTILFVTHDLDEALLLGDEIIILSPKPTSIVKRFTIDASQKERGLENMQSIKEDMTKILNHASI